MCLDYLKKRETNFIHIINLSKLDPYGLTSYDCILNNLFIFDFLIKWISINKQSN